MNYYGKHPQEQAVQTLIHDMNQRTYGLRSAIRKLKAGSADDAQLANQLEATERLIAKTIDEYIKKWEAFPAPTS